MTNYQGSCHCGAVHFEVEAEIDHVRECDCSICRRRGSLNFRVSREALRVLTGTDELSIYRWGSMTGEDYFCRTCGILPFRKPGALTANERADGRVEFDGWAVNVRCLQGVDFDNLPRLRIEGSKLHI
jgi:hypothetical protein